MTPATAAVHRHNVSMTWIRHRPLAAALVAFTAVVPAAFARPKRTRTPTAAPSPTAVAATPTPAAAPRPAALVPDPAWVGTPAAGERPSAAILRAKKAGATDDELLARIAKDDVRYYLSTAEIQQLRAAGVGTRVVEAMLRSGRTPLPTSSGGATTRAVTTTPPSQTTPEHP